MSDWSPPAAAQLAARQHRGWFWEVLIAIDILANTIIGGASNDTISARCGRSIAYRTGAHRIPWPRWWVKHCYWAAGYAPPTP